MVGKTVRLRPLREDDFDALYGVARDPDIWAMHPCRDRFERCVFQEFFIEAINSGGAFAIFDLANDVLIGSTRFGNFEPKTNEIEIGWTFLACSHWRRGYNREVKRLMLAHIFKFVDAVIFQIGASNFRSRTAVERLGSRLCGAHERQYAGVVQDYVVYRLTQGEAQTGALSGSFS